ncbi:WcbI family polysaccharide biosynthesis putative acetyltransferase [Maridesulfovibrio bastinii]|uniref:WcbI family polysaccharide biosynthesis putative acetyltransferase n=1 Tax=Maridesulfovibrio bastinii TaxID=47157 RepID=UPI0004010F03|nr:WcbI family polysaccharide biosynthesis putative acetyltransferase [Maridesulfovibrio bastinii]
MAKKKCIIHSNCQGEALRDILFLSAEFKNSYDVQIYTNYIREKIPPKALSECSLFLYQKLSSKWGDLASEKLIPQLPEQAKHIAFPSMLFTFYWPTWERDIDFAYPDSLLESLLKRELSEWEILHIYLKSDIRKMLDLDAIVEKAEKWERFKESETPIKYVDRMYENFRSYKIFNTFNHPGKDIMVYTASRILEILGIEQPSGRSLKTMPDPFPDFEMPIHPQIGEYWGLDFCSEETLYNVYGSKMTFKEYAALYIKCRKLGIDDFISFLRVVADSQKKKIATD